MPYYIVVKQSPQWHQMSLEEFLFGTFSQEDLLINANTSNTRTYKRYSLTEKFNRLANPEFLIGKLKEFNASVERLRVVDRRNLYHTFYIPKRSGHKMRRIDQPLPDLMEALRELKRLFETYFRAEVTYHTSAFAYVKGRCAIDAVKRHQLNESKWFCKLDLHDFFGSTTLDFVMQQFSMLFPFSQVISDEEGAEELRKALELGFLDGGLPQGTPLSPLITNLMMVPVDFEISAMLRKEGNFVYTRYADDTIISSKYDFLPRSMQEKIGEIYESFNAPFRFNEEKTRYGSASGRNWNLGVMLNKDNVITIGHKKKRELKAALHNYAMDKRGGVDWDVHDVQVLRGLYEYAKAVEPVVMQEILQNISQKVGVDILSEMQKDLKRI